MEAKEIKIVPPKCYEIDKENSAFECIKFKLKHLTYNEVAKELFKNEHFYYIMYNGEIGNSEHTITNSDTKYNKNNATSKKQLEKLLAINKLLNVSRFLNGREWKPDMNSEKEKFVIILRDNNIQTACVNFVCGLDIHFKTKELAKQAIDILGEDTIRLALSTDW